MEKVLSAAGRERGYSRLMGCLARSHFSFVLANDCSLFRPLVAYVQETITHLGLGDAAERTRVGVALEEALTNALYHGNLQVASNLREEDEQAYYSLIEQRSQETPFRDRRIYVEATLSREDALFVVRDEGGGFDPASLPDPTEPSNLDKATGRGVLLMRTFMDEVQYNTQGNEVRLRKRCSRSIPLRPMI